MRGNNNVSFWDIKKDGITQSLMSCFQGCERKAYYRYKLGLTNPETTVALNFGNSMHRLIELYLTGGQEKEAFKQLETELLNADTSLTTTNEQAIEELLAQLEPVFFGWVDYWKMKQAHKWVALEKEFSIPFMDTGINLRGKVDGIYETNKGNLGILETKTMGQISEDILYKLSFDRQLMLYCYAIGSMFNNRVTNCTYNIIRRPLLRRGKSETLDTFCARIKEDIAKRPEHYFTQYEISIKQVDVFNIAVMYKEVVKAIKRFANKPIKKEGAYIQNANECIKVYGSCEYIGKCSNCIDLKPLVMKDKVFSELE